MTRTNRTVAAAVLAVLALSATACNSPTKAAQQAASDLSPAALLKLVGEKTTAAKSAKVEMTMQAGPVQTTGKGAIDWSNGLIGELNMQVQGGQTTGLMSGGAMEVRYLPDGIYEKMPDAQSAMMGGKHWLAMKYAELGKLSGTGDALKSQVKNSNPLTQVNMLIASGKVQKVGTDQVNGKSATHYAGDITAADMAAANGVSSADADEIKQMMTEAGVTTEHVEVWIDSDRLPVKVAGSGDTKAGKMNFTATYSDWGTKVSPQAPPAGDTLDFGTMMNQLTKGIKP